MMNKTENTLYILQNLSSTESKDLDYAEIDVYYEDEQGNEGATQYDMPAIADDATSTINELQSKIAELENQWISVEDRLPYESAFVIAKSIGVTESKHQTGVLVLYYCTAYTKSERFQSQHRASHVTVTHWMPLPTPPNETLKEQVK